MVTNINLIAFGTFGNPNGFKQTFFVGSEDLAKASKTFDLNTNAIRLFQNSKLYSIRKEYVSGLNSIAYSIYTFAKEQNSERTGTFIGSSILFTEKVCAEAVTLDQLNEFHSNLIFKNVLNDVINVNHSDKLIVSKPKEFDKLSFHLREIVNLNFVQSTGKSLVVFTQTTNDILSGLFKKSIDLLNVYDTIYFTDSRDIAEFVNQKGIFKIIQNVGDKREFDHEIEKLAEERKRKREKSIFEFERELQRLNNENLNTINDYKLQIEQSEKVHRENEILINESKKNLEITEQLCKDFYNKIQELENQIKSGRNIEEVKQLYSENKKLFIEGLNILKRPNYINKLPKNNPRINLKPENQTPKTENRHRKQIVEINELAHDQGYKIDKFKISTLLLLILLVFSWSYSSFFKENIEEPKRQVQENAVYQTVPLHVEEKPKSIALPPLNPIPNSELNENDFRIVAKKITYETNIDDIVKIIFSINPTEIERHYKGQEITYSKHLFDLNKNCFEEIEGIIYFYKDTLRHIPSFKK